MLAGSKRTELTITDTKTASVVNSIKASFIRLYAVTPASILDSLMLPHLLDPENEHDDDSAESAIQENALINC